MGNRLSKIYTRTGDKGTSGLGDGSRVAKNHLRMEAMGSVDELNSFIGLLISHLEDEAIIDVLTRAQHHLFNIGGEISMPGHAFITSENVTLLEECIDRYNQDLEPLKDFILPGGTQAASICHIARATARRAERDVISLDQSEDVNAFSKQYINRMSDVLFVLARIINKNANVKDVLWCKQLN